MQRFWERPVRPRTGLEDPKQRFRGANYKEYALHVCGGDEKLRVRFIMILVLSII